jgi:hypothetical protein
LLAKNGKQFSVHGVQYLLNKHRITASAVCASLKKNGSLSIAEAHHGYRLSKSRCQ